MFNIGDRITLTELAKKEREISPNIETKGVVLERSFDDYEKKYVYIFKTPDERIFAGYEYDIEEA